jgi:putative DNA primase/helicase
MTTSTQQDLLMSALNYAALGWPVVPLYPVIGGHCTCKKGPDCDSAGKHPWVSWKDGGSVDPNQIKNWWSQRPLSNIGIVTGKVSGIWLLDIDGDPGRESVKKQGELPQTPLSNTGRGHHVLFKYPTENIRTTNRAGFLPGLDIRGDGGLFVAPPSNHYSGSTYKWVTRPGEMPLADCPPWLIESLREKKTADPRPGSNFKGTQNKNYAAVALKEECEKVRSAQKGTRNSTLNDAAFSLGQLIGGGELGQWEVENELLSAAVSIGLPPSEAKATIKSGLDAGVREPRSAPPPTKSKEFQEAKAEQPPQPKVDPTTGEVQDDLFLAGYSADDDGNADAFISVYGKDFLFCIAYGWLWWTDTHWQTALAEQKLFEKVTEVLKRRRVAGVQAEKEAVVKCSKPNSATINNAISLLEKKLEVLVDTFDQSPTLLNCHNGVLNLRTGQLTGHTPEQRFTYCIPTDYDPATRSQEWENFLKSVVGGGPAVLDYLQQALGYTLTGHTIEECLFYLYGPSRSGKGTLTEVLMVLMGRPLSAEADFSTFTAKRDGDSNNFDLAPLKPARVVFASESERYQRLNPAKIKQLTGGNMVYCCFKHREHFNYRPQYKLWLSSNWPVNGDVDDDALWGRVRVIEFPNSYLGREDKKLKLRLKQPENLRAAFAWLVEGAKRWYAAPNGLETPAEVTKSTQRQRDEADFIQSWLDENCEQDMTAWESNADVYANYDRWCKSNGVEARQMRNLTASLKTKGYTVNTWNRRNGVGSKGIQGLKIIPRI